MRKNIGKGEVRRWDKEKGNEEEGLRGRDLGKKRKVGKEDRVGAGEG